MRWVSQVDGVDLSLRETLLTVVSQHYRQRFGGANGGESDALRSVLKSQLLEGSGS